jgi:hypothetical protein
VRTGRPSKLTPEVRERILQAVRGGNFRDVAAQWAGIAPETLSRWLVRPESTYVAFRQALIEAEQQAEIRAVALILKAAETDPRNAQWWLERKFPERWGRRERVDVELYIRTRAMALGLDQEVALREVKAGLRALPTA